MEPSVPPITPNQPESTQPSTGGSAPLTPLTPAEAPNTVAPAPAHRRSPLEVLRRARMSGIAAGLVIATIVLLIAFFYISSKGRQNTPAVTSGSLTDSELQKLSSSHISTNSSTQELTFHSPTSFDSTLKVAGAASVKDLAVSGVFNPTNIDISKDFQVGGSSLLQGDVVTKGQLTVGKNLNVTGSSIFGGNTSFGGNATFNSGASFAGSLSANSLSVKTASIGGLSFGHIITTGATPGGSMAIGSGGGSVVISGNDTSGTITVTLGGSPHSGEMANLNFRTGFSSTPHVSLTPVGSSSAAAQYYVTRSVSSFTIGLLNPTPNAQYVFDYLVMQ